MWHKTSDQYPPEDTIVLANTYVGVMLMKWLQVGEKRIWQSMYGGYTFRIHDEPHYAPTEWLLIPELLGDR